ncbi:LysR substrate-binding domain-containing protein [Luteimonas suaedae]|uniref:LysR substrate-binding domain-containing protein n=1 Tax=Luteimonas suaedae TaxID=2605430 RepID=UPI0011ED466F|nr:LysR substrate-binding domain-containing protein [Luteimonas suaedae]
MDRPNLPLNGLRAFEAAARHLNFTRAALELCVTQAALSHRIKGLEARLGFALFRRLPRGVALTDEGAALFPVINDAFDRIGAVLGRFEGGQLREALIVSAVATFATGWLLPRLDGFTVAHPGVDLRLLTHNNRIDQAGEGLDLAIRFGDGAWQGLDAARICDAPLVPMCAPALARRIERPRDLAGVALLRSYRPDEWARWFAAARLPAPPARGPVFDSSLAIASAAASGAGVALLPLPMFGQDLAAERLVRLFDIAVDAGAYWLTRLRSRTETAAMRAFREWIADEAVA